MLSNYVNPLPGVPSVESPFFDELFTSDDPWIDVARSLHDRGYAVINFPDDAIADRAERIKADLTPFFPLRAWHAGEPLEMRYQDAWKISDDVRAIATNSVIIDLLSHLYGRQAFPLQTLNFPIGTQQQYHSDSVHFSSRPERFMVGVWLALEDIGLDQGPLLYYPGSHKWPIYTNEHIGHRVHDPAKIGQATFEPLWQRLVDVHKVEPERLCVKQGQALIWAANLLHGGDIHRDRQQTRWSQVTHYYFRDCVYYTPLASNEPFGEILHREPYDIISGAPTPGTYLNQALSPEYLQATAFKPIPREPEPWETPDDGFDGDAYLAAHPDVAADGWNPFEHYYRFGRHEGRRLR